MPLFSPLGQRSWTVTFLLLGIVSVVFCQDWLDHPAVAQPNEIETGGPVSSPAVLPEREQFQSLPLPSAPAFWALPPLATIPGPSQLVQQFYGQTLTPQRLGEGDFGCFRAQNATINRLTSDTVAVILTEMGSCDDSLSGQQIRVDFRTQGDRWQMDWVGQRNHCRGKFWADPGQRCP